MIHRVLLAWFLVSCACACAPTPWQDLWTKGDQQFLEDSATIVKLRNSGAAHAALKVTALTYTCQKLSAPLEQAMEAETKLKQARSSLEDWEHFKKQFHNEAEKFKLACQQRQEQVDARILHDLSEASRVAKLGAEAAEAYSKTCLYMPAYGSMVLETGNATFAKFLQDVALLEQARAPIPTLVLWDLNGIHASQLATPVHAKLCQQLQLMKELLSARPQYTMGVILLRRVSPGGSLTKRALHSAVCAALETKGIDCDMDVALNFKEVPRLANSIFSLLTCCISVLSCILRMSPT